jgi:hypothetical protein
MKKLLALGAIASSLAMLPQAAQAATNTATFTVTASVTAQCTINNTVAVVPGQTTTALAFGTYTAFGAALPAPTPLVAYLNCTRGLTGVKAQFDVGSGSAGAQQNIGTQATAEGILDNGLKYTLTADGVLTAAGSNPTTALNNIGVAASYTYTIGGTILAGQAGTCGTATCASSPDARTLTITY